MRVRESSAHCTPHRTKHARARSGARRVQAGCSTSVVEPLVSAARVLLVIETTRDARAIDATLRRAGWQPFRTRVTTAEELASVLRKGGCQAVVVDCRLRRLNVLDAIAAVLDHDVDLPVMAISEIFDNLAVETMRAGAADYLLLADVRRLPAALATELGKAGERRELRRAHEELSTSESRFRTLARATNQIVWTIGADGRVDGPIDDWTAFTGQSLEEFSGEGWLDALHPDDRERAGAAWQRAIESSEPFEADYRLRQKGGGYRWISSRVVPLRDASGAVIQWIGADRDVTDHLGVMRDLATERDLHARLMATSPAFFCAVDADGKIMLMNQALLDRLGYSLDEVVGVAFVALLIPAADQASVEAEIWKLLGGHESVTRELTMMRAGGGELLVEWCATPVFSADGEIHHVAGVGIDVTERAGAEAVLRENEARFRLLFDAAPLPYQSLDTDGAITAVNDAWLESFGYRRDDVVGRPFAELLAAGQGERLRDVLERTAAKGRAETEFELVRADGETVSVAFDARSGLDAGGQCCQAHCILVDVTARRRAVEDLQRSDDRYRVLSRSASSWIWTRRLDGGLVAPFESFLEYTGMTAEEADGGGWLTPVHPSDRSGVALAWEAATTHGATFSMEHRLRRHDGVYEWFAVHGSPVLDADGSLVEYVGTSVNVHERNLAIEALRESDQRHRALFEQSPVGVFVFDRDARLTECNAEFARMMKVEPARLIGRGLREMVDADVVAALEAALNGEAGAFEGAFHGGRNGDSLIATMHTSSLRGADGAVSGGMGVIADVTERHRFLDRIDRLAFTDLVTGLPNRAALDCRLQEALGLAALNTHKIALAVLNIDRFRHVYDTRGGHAADRLLVAVGARLAQHVGENDTVARAGGDEFLVLLPDVSGLDDVVAASDRIASGFRSAVQVDGEPIYIQLSIGVALSPDDVVDADELVRDATVAMRRAKRDGGGVWRLYDRAMDAKFAGRLALESELHQALRNGELTMHYQPLVRGSQAAVVGVEALVRWQHPVRGLLAPAEFIPLAEDTGLILPMGEWILEAACRQVKVWHDTGLTKLRLAVNLSARQLGDDALPETIARIIEVSGLEAKYVEIEVTETAVMDNADLARSNVRKLKRLGVRLALDDFGTGYSSLSLLSSLPIHTVKIDRSFVAGMLEHHRDMTIVTSVIALGHRLGLNVVAEGVETREQFEALRSNGCDEMQGYFFGRPLPAAECKALLRRGNLLG